MLSLALAVELWDSTPGKFPNNRDCANPNHITEVAAHEQYHSVSGVAAILESMHSLEKTTKFNVSPFPTFRNVAKDGLFTYRHQQEIV